MEKDKHTTDINFRVEKSNKEVFALFPHEVCTYEGDVTVYQHIGQHMSADYRHCLSTSRPAKESEYKDLKQEMENMGYNIKVVVKQNYDKYLESYKEVNGWRV